MIHHPYNITQSFAIHAPPTHSARHPHFTSTIAMIRAPPTLIGPPDEAGRGATGWNCAEQHQVRQPPGHGGLHLAHGRYFVSVLPTIKRARALASLYPEPRARVS